MAKQVKKSAPSGGNGGLSEEELKEQGAGATAKGPGSTTEHTPPAAQPKQAKVTVPGGKRFKRDQKVVIGGPVTRIGENGNVTFRGKDSPEITLTPDHLNEEDLAVGDQVTADAVIVRCTDTQATVRVGSEKDKNEIEFTLPIEQVNEEE